MTVDLEDLKKVLDDSGYGIRYIPDPEGGETYLDYSKLLELMDYEVLFEKSCGSYQGDLVFLLKHPEKGFGFTVVGYGSCSGCDALEACDSVSDVHDLMQTLDNHITWRESKIELAGFLAIRDKANHWHWNDDEVNAAADEIVDILSGEAFGESRLINDAEADHETGVSMIQKVDIKNVGILAHCVMDWSAKMIAEAGAQGVQFEVSSDSVVLDAERLEMFIEGLNVLLEELKNNEQ